MISSRPQILYVTSCFPNARSSGSHLRVRQIGRALQDIGEVHFVVAGFDGPSEAGNSTEFVVDRSFPLGEVRRKGGWSQLGEAISARTINPYGHSVSSEAQAWMEQHLESFDLIWLHNLRIPAAFN